MKNVKAYAIFLEFALSLLSISQQAKINNIIKIRR
jgi:hypothetical protein